MTTNNTAVDWAIVLAWSLRHAILTALVGRTAVNAAITYDQIRLDPGARKAHRWVGTCKACRRAHRVVGTLASGWRKGHGSDQIVISGTSCYVTAGHGTDATTLWVPCCAARAKLQRVYDSHKPSRPRHECIMACGGGGIEPLSCPGGTVCANGCCLPVVE